MNVKLRENSISFPSFTSYIGIFCSDKGQPDSKTHAFLYFALFLYLASRTSSNYQV